MFGIVEAKSNQWIVVVQVTDKARNSTKVYEV